MLSLGLKKGTSCQLVTPLLASRLQLGGDIIPAGKALGVNTVTAGPDRDRDSEAVAGWDVVLCVFMLGLSAVLSKLS